MEGLRLAAAAQRLVLALVLGLAVGGSAMAAPTVEDFFKPDAYADIRLSPSGKRLAATVAASNGRRSLAVIDLADSTKSKILVSYTNVDVWNVQWVNDDRLIYSVADMKETLRGQKGTGLFAIDAAGGKPARAVILPSWTSGISHADGRTLGPNYTLHSVLRDGSDAILVRRNVYETSGKLLYVGLLRANTRTGALINLYAGAPDHVVDWAADAKGRPRMAMTAAGDRTALYHKPNDETGWVKVLDGARFGSSVPELLYAESVSRIYAVANLEPHSDVASLVVMDPTEGAGRVAFRVLLTTPGFDFNGSLVTSTSGEVLGVRYLTEARGTHWFDSRLKSIQQRVDELLPGSNNWIDCGACGADVDNVLVAYSADRVPATYRVFNVSKGTLQPVASSRPWIRPQDMATTDMNRVTMRDGLSVPVYVTRPKDQGGPAPAVVLVHGGPWLRGVEWKWRDEAQFLASRGYVVIEPEFRGSTGYGSKLFRAGWKEWGRAMQDDVADAALWAVEQGYADRQRIAIAGASYGGYATLMGLIRNPEIFRCGISWVGVTDIGLMYSLDWSDLSDEYRRHGMPLLVGDREKDADQLAATSPIRQAAKLTQPLLMAYGEIDRRVPIEHGKQMRDALAKTNKNVEWKVYAGEGHGWLLPANTYDFWTRVETFLDKNLRNAPPQ